MQPKIGIIWSFPQNYHQLPEVPLVHPKIGIIWSFSQNYLQSALPEFVEFRLNMNSSNICHASSVLVLLLLVFTGQRLITLEFNS